MDKDKNEWTWTSDKTALVREGVYYSVCKMHVADDMLAMTIVVGGAAFVTTVPLRLLGFLIEMEPLSHKTKMLRSLSDKDKDAFIKYNDLIMDGIAAKHKRLEELRRKAPKDE